ncbi:choice-of-anchor Q domain-containing protein [Pedobacter ureilyticus]|uniref:Choice-of-anchor Q domain-containing protein n=1 Tax=Pedobacter ureilyticus TaxID=1393051 RepID=A0ABW9J5G8_9SPHI
MNKQFNIMKIKTATLTTFFILSTYFSFAQTSDANGILYVKKGSTGNGSSWNNAIGELADALKAAKSNTAIQQIWVTGGTYKPLYSPADNNFGNDAGRDNTFLLVKDVKLYGGFSGTESSLNERNFKLMANKTILSGDLNGNDETTSTITANADNTNHVVLSVGNIGNATLDRFTIVGGNANTASTIIVNGQTIYQDRGAGIYNQGASPKITNCVISGHIATADHAGAGVYNHLAAPSITNSLITGNKASGNASGAGIYSIYSTPILLNTTVAANSSTGAASAALYHHLSSPTIANTLIYGNNSGILENNTVQAPVYQNPTIAINDNSTGTDPWNNPSNALTDNSTYATMSNEAMLIAGTIRDSHFLTIKGLGLNVPPNAEILGIEVEIRKFSSDNTSSNYTRDLDIRLLKNDQVEGTNHANIGINWPTSETAFTYGTNTDLWGLTLIPADVNSSDFGVAIAVTSKASGLLLPTIISYIDQVRVKVSYQVDALTTVSYSLIQGGFAGTSNLDIDPKFANPTTFASAPINTGNYILNSESPAISAGNNLLYNNNGGNLTTDKDLLGNKRLSNTTIDIGAYEYQELAPDDNHILYVKKGSTGNGSSWNDAIGELADALKFANANRTIVSQIWVSKGVYKPLYNQGVAIVPKERSFTIAYDVKLYGGFDPDNGITNLSHQRIIPNATTEAPNGTILSGDLDNNDTNGPTGNNVYHVVSSPSSPNYALSHIELNGFTITGGLASGESPNSVGYNTSDGAGIYSNSMIGGSTIILVNCSMNGNQASGNGGAVISQAGAALNSTVTIINCNISKNSAGSGGSIYSEAWPPVMPLPPASNSSTINISNSSISENSSNSNGGIYSKGPFSKISVTNSKIHGNTALADGAGIYSDASNTSNLILQNSTIADNKGQNFIFLKGSSKTFTSYNSIIFNNKLESGAISNISTNSGSINKDIKYSLVQEESDTANGNLDGTSASYTNNNLFTNAANGDYSLKEKSAAINAGNNMLYENADGDGGNNSLTIDKDIAGNNRLRIGFIDMGAFESPYNPTPIPDANGIIYVKKNGTGGLRGNSWTNATAELADALIAAKVLNANTPNTVKQIWVSKGIYKPLYGPHDAPSLFGTDQGRNNAFLMVNGVKLYGGFDPDNGINLPEHNRILPTQTNGTILSGDLDNNDTTTPQGNNAYHVIIAASENIALNTELNGFTITGGLADGSGAIGVANLIVRRNNGGGIYSESGTASNEMTLTQCYISYNSTSDWGGGIYLLAGSTANLNIYRSTISKNSGTHGGGIHSRSTNASSTTTTINSILSGNSAGAFGGAIFAYANPNATNSIKLQNSTVASNESPFFIYFANGSIYSFTAYNSIAYQNTYNNLPDIAFLDGAGKSVTKDIKHSLIQHEFGTANGNINGVPWQFTNDNLFVDATNGDYTLKPDGLAINTGNNTLYEDSDGNSTNNSLATDKDLAGNQRLVGPSIDLGPFENMSTLPVSLLSFTVKKDNNAAILTWETASEKDNAGFEILRAADDKSFVSLAIVTGKGTTDSKNSYLWYDRKPLNGNNYYKLIQKDKDGKIEELGIRTLNFSLNNEDILLYPNPVIEKANVIFASGRYKNIALSDISGKILQSITLNYTETEKVISIDKLPKGIYLLRFTGDERSTVLKMIKN